MKENFPPWLIAREIVTISSDRLKGLYLQLHHYIYFYLSANKLNYYYMKFLLGSNKRFFLYFNTYSNIFWGKKCVSSIEEAMGAGRSH